MKKDDIVNAARSLFTDYGYKKVSIGAFLYQKREGGMKND